MIKKILYHSNYNFCDEQGGSINEFEFCKTLSSCFSRDAFFVLNEKNAIFIRDSPNFYHENIKFIKDIKFSRPITWLTEFFVLLRMVRAHDVDLVVSRISGLIFPLFFLCLLTKTKLAIKTAGTTYMKDQPKGVLNKVYSFVEKKLRVFVLNKASCIDVPTPELKKLVQQETENKNIFIVPNGTNTDFFNIKNTKSCREKYGIPSQAKVLGFVGTWPSEDGGLHLLQILCSLKEIFKNIIVVIAGEDPNMDLLYSYTKKRNLEKSVLFLGKKPYEEMPEVISTFDIGYSFVPLYILERNGNSSQKTRQYLSCGIPVITMKNGHEFVEKYDFLGEVVDSPDDLESIIAKTVTLLRREDLQEQKNLRRQFASNNLSNYSLLNKRLEFWQSILNNEK